MKTLWTVLCIVLGFAIFGAGCSKKKSPDDKLTLTVLQGKKVALVDIDGPKESRTHVEVALVNELIERGRFEILDRATVQEARTEFPADSDFGLLGKKLGAELVFKVRVDAFDIKEREGHDKVEEEDSILTQESGEKKPVVGTRYVKVKRLDGTVEITGTFYDVAARKIVYSGKGNATGSHDNRGTGRVLKMELLEHLTRQAVTDFFEKIP